MREVIIGKNEDGQRLNKFLMKYLNLAPSSFIYKMLRKKNIKINDKKADGSEIVSIGDTVKIFLSDDTIAKFKSDILNDYNLKKSNGIYKIDNDILYQDEDIIVINKPSGILSQKAERDDYSVNEAVVDYTLNNGIISKDELSTFKPSVCNRLDRNTSGIIWAGISLKGSKELSQAFKDRSIDKYYYTIVKGKFDKKLIVDGYISRDEDKLMSKVITCEKYEELSNDAADKRYDNLNLNNNYTRIETGFYPVSYGNDYTLIRIKLITGKTHQIRAHLKSLGFPVAGDVKYGDKDVNSYMRDKYNLRNHLLHAGDARWKDKSISVHADLPDNFKKICDGEGIVWQPGIQED
ncbi:MAG: RluA family pseudouridine synthase [Lachnospiraceae bacterium]|nr:RluA family pseudouridine synthase [Lachnospiraceae bacterium]